MIRKVISDINSSFEKLVVTELVPLPEEHDVLIEYRDLIGHELAKREEVFIGKIGRAYSVQSLLNGIEDERTRREHLTGPVVNFGTYINQSSSGNVSASIINAVAEKGVDNMSYQPQTWEKVATYATALCFIVSIMYLLIRNQAIADPNLVVALRILLSLAVAVFGGSVPGMLRVDLTSKKGVAIRATGALALFVISFLMTPKVFEHH